MSMQSVTHRVHSGFHHTGTLFSEDSSGTFAPSAFSPLDVGSTSVASLTAPALSWSPAASGLVPFFSGTGLPVVSSESSFATVSTPGSGLVFDNTYTSSCTAQYIACIVAAEEQLESLFTNADTINETFQEVNEGNNGEALGNSFYYLNYSYAQVRAAVLALAPNDVLPTTDPSGGANWEIPVSYARMLGLTTYTEPTDDTVTLNTYYGWDYGQDVINGLTHELSEGGLGRIGALGGSGGGGWSTMDLFRYNGSGQADYSNGRDGQTTYFSSNGGASLSDVNLPGKGAPTLSFNNQYNSDGTKANGGDTADWVQNAVFGSTGGGETLALTQTELDVMQALGWHLSLVQDVDGTSGSWETPTSWSTGSMPIEAQDVDIKGAVVSLDSDVIVNSIATSGGGILEIGDSTATTLTAVDGTDLNSKDSSSTATGNLGDIFVYTGSTLQIGYFGNDFDNVGTLTLGKGAGGSGTGYLDIAGEITLEGGGTLALGQTGTYGDILNAPSTTGDSLINVNNVMTGSGLIDLGATFDNQSGGTVEAQSFLHISVGTFTNEGAITVEAGATLDLGLDGTTQSIDNSGSVLVLANSEVQISGAYTNSGSGDLYLKGAGAAITSDGTAATFVNAGTIEADNTSQIGDSNLTFTNSGSVAVSLSGNVLTIDTGAHTIVNTGTLAAVNSGTLAIASDLNNSGSVTAGGISSTETTTGTVQLGLDGGGAAATNSGVIAVYGDSDLAIRGDYTVTGSGYIGLKGAGADITSDGLAPATLTNASTIDAFASGQIGDSGILSANDLSLVNTGSIVALGSAVTLTINTGAHMINDAGGSLIAEDSAVLLISSNVNTGAGGSIDAESDSTVLIGGALSGGGTLYAASGALLETTGGGSFGGAITGAGEVIIAGGATTLTAGASLSAGYVIDAANLTLASVSITNAAANTFLMTESSGVTITLKSTGTGALTNDGSMVIDGGGTSVISAPLIDNGAISVTAGNLQITGAFSGTGALTIAGGTSAYITAGGVLTEAISGAGRLVLGGAYALSHADVTVATVQVNATHALSGTGTLTGALVDNGAVAASGGTLLVDGGASGTGTLSAGAGAVLDLLGGAAISGAISGAGTVILGGATTLHTGATLSAAKLVEKSSLVLASVAVTNTAGNTFDLYASSGSTISLQSTGTGAFTNAGNLIANGPGTATVSAPFANSGTVSASAGTLSFVGSVAGTGTMDVGAAGKLVLGLGAGSGQTVDFLGSTGILALGTPLDFAGVIDGFGGSDDIYLKNTTFTSFSFSNNLLTVKDGSATVASLHITESSNAFSLTNTDHNVLIRFT